MEGLGKIVLPSGDVVRTAGRYDDVRRLLADSRFSRDLRAAPGARFVRGADVSDDPHSLLNMDPPRHTRLRRIVSGAFSRRRIEGWRPRVAQVAEELGQRMAAGGAPQDLVAAFAFPLPVRVICELLGVPEDDRERFRDWAETALSTAGAGDRAEAVREFRAYVKGLLADRRERPGDALIDALLDARDGSDALTERELVTLITNLIAAGHETTANLIATGVFTLVTTGLYRGLEPAEGVVEELLRHATPARFGLPRLATGDVDLPSGTVREGETVLPLLIDANRDPAVFTEPDRFDPGRFEQDGAAHVTFGHGAHFCLGAHLARLEVEAALGVLLRRFPELELAVPAAEVPWRAGTLVEGPRSLPVRW